MTRDQIVAIVAQRLNLTSATALARVAESVNEKYAEVLSGVGMQTSTRRTVTAQTTIGSRYLTFASVMKVYSVFDPNGTGIPFAELTVDELRNRPVRTDPPQAYAIQTVDATSVTIWLDCTPATVYSLSADVEFNLALLGASDEPAFPQKFHYMLVHGARGIELDKMEKIDLASKAEAKFQTLLSGLRYHLAISGYKDIHQGKMGIDTFPTQLI